MEGRGIVATVDRGRRVVVEQSRPTRARPILVRAGSWGEAVQEAVGCRKGVKRGTTRSSKAPRQKKIYKTQTKFNARVA